MGVKLLQLRSLSFENLMNEYRFALLDLPLPKICFLSDLLFVWDSIKVLTDFDFRSSALTLISSFVFLEIALPLVIVFFIFFGVSDSMPFFIAKVKDMISLLIKSSIF